MANGDDRQTIEREFRDLGIDASSVV